MAVSVVPAGVGGAMGCRTGRGWVVGLATVLVGALLTGCGSGATSTAGAGSTGGQRPAGPAGGVGGGKGSAAALHSAVWGAGAPLPRSVSEVGVAAVGASVHVLGGYVDGHPRSTTHLVLDTTSGQWRSAAPLPVAADHVGAVGLNGLLYAIGGYVNTAGGSGGSTAVWSYDPGTDRWTARAGLPNRRAAGIAVALDGKVHLVGGKSRGADTGEHDVFDPTSGGWTQAAPMPTPRDHAAGAVVGGRLYIAGGRPGALTALESFDPAAGSWSSLPSLPSGRSSSAGAGIDGQFLVLGGENATETTVTARVDAYDPTNRTWSRIADLPASRQGVGAAVIGGTVYLPGGAPTAGGSQQSDTLLHLH